MIKKLSTEKGTVAAMLLTKEEQTHQGASISQWAAGSPNRLSSQPTSILALPALDKYIIYINLLTLISDSFFIDVSRSWFIRLSLTSWQADVGWVHEATHTSNSSNMIWDMYHTSEDDILTSIMAVFGQFKPTQQHHIWQKKLKKLKVVGHPDQLCGKLWAEHPTPFLWSTSILRYTHGGTD